MISALKAPVASPLPQQAPSDTAQQYQQADALINAMDQVVRQAPESREALRELSSELKAKFRGELVAVPALPALAEEAHRAALQALAAGLLAGAMDGVLAFVPSPQAPAPQPPAPAPQPPAPTPAAAAPQGIGDDLKEDLKRLQEALDKLMEDLGRAAGEAAGRLKTLGPKALQLTSRGQKATGSLLVDQATRFPGHPNTPLLAWQTYLASVFALGYGVAINDAALIVLAGQQPQA